MLVTGPRVGYWKVAQTSARARGARVVIAARNKEKLADSAKAEIEAATAWADRRRSRRCRRALTEVVRGRGGGASSKNGPSRARRSFRHLVRRRVNPAAVRGAWRARLGADAAPQPARLHGGGARRAAGDEGAAPRPSIAVCALDGWPGRRLRAIAAPTRRRSSRCAARSRCCGWSKPHGVGVSLVFRPDTDTPCVAKENEMLAHRVQTDLRQSRAVLRRRCRAWHRQRRGVGDVSRRRRRRQRRRLDAQPRDARLTAVGLLGALFVGLFLLPLFRLISIATVVLRRICAEERRRSAGRRSRRSEAEAPSSLRSGRVRNSASILQTLAASPAQSE